MNKDKAGIPASLSNKLRKNAKYSQNANFLEPFKSEVKWRRKPPVPNLKTHYFSIE